MQAGRDRGGGLTQMKIMKERYVKIYSPKWQGIREYRIYSVGEGEETKYKLKKFAEDPIEISKNDFYKYWADSYEKDVFVNEDIEAAN